MIATTADHPGLEGVVAGATALSLVDGGERSSPLPGYRIGDLIECGTYAQAPSCCDGKLARIRLPAPGARPAFGRGRPCAKCRAMRIRWTLSGPHCRSTRGPSHGWPPSLEQARCLTDSPPPRCGVRPASGLASRRSARTRPQDLASGFLYQLAGRQPDPATVRALVPTSRGGRTRLNASTFAARVHHFDALPTWAALLCGAIGALKGPLHGGLRRGRHQLRRDRHVPNEPTLGTGDDRTWRSHHGVRPPRVPGGRSAGCRLAPCRLSRWRARPGLAWRWRSRSRSRATGC